MGIQPVDLEKMTKQGETLYQAIAITAKRARQINDEIKTEYMARISTLVPMEEEDDEFETTNFDRRLLYRNASENLKIIERFRRVGPDTIEWSVTLDDPHTWTRPWTFAMILKQKTEGEKVYEYACHEGNYGLKNILTGARAEDKH